jgi:hypothetical protein
MKLINGEAIPTKLPCGKHINQNYRTGDVMQCCVTECPEKAKNLTDKNNPIELCYKAHKRGLI